MEYLEFIPKKIAENADVANNLAGQIGAAIELNVHLFKRRGVALALNTNTHKVLNDLPNQIRTSLSTQADILNATADIPSISEPLEIILAHKVAGCEDYIRDVIFAITH